MATHDYAGCQIEPCERCQDYGQGYSDGKRKAQWEAEGGAVQTHAHLWGPGRIAEHDHERGAEAHAHAKDGETEFPFDGKGGKA